MFDKALQKVCRKTDNCHYLPLNFQPKAEFLATDGYHPSEVAYQLWGQMLADFIHELKQEK
jgi:lysophospholipase L1-like esterase